MIKLIAIDPATGKRSTRSHYESIGMHTAVAFLERTAGRYAEGRRVLNQDQTEDGLKTHRRAVVDDDNQPVRIFELEVT